MAWDARRQVEAKWIATGIALGLEGFAGVPGEASFTAIALLLASLSDREFFYGTPPKHRR
jgi:hypothetical protein